MNAPGGRDITGRTDLLESALAASDLLTLDGHGLETDDPVTVRAAEGGTLAAPLAAGTVYYAIRITNAAFKLAAAPAGSAINLTTDGAEMTVSRDPDYDTEIEATSRWMDRFLPAHVVPLGVSEPVPADIVRICADTTARRMLVISGKSSDSVTAIELEGKAQLERFVTNAIPLRGVETPGPANLAISGASTSDPRGWGTGGCIP